MTSPTIVFRLHAVERMQSRGISEPDVASVVQHGVTVESRETAYPYPIRVVLGFPKGRPIHVVIAENHADNMVIVVTAYEPDRSHWNKDFATRRVQ